MENWVILSKLAVIIYCAMKFSMSAGNITIVILFVLIYVIVNMACHLVKINFWKNLFISLN